VPTPVRPLERYARLEAPLVTVSLDVLTSIFLGGLVGVLEVTLAHALLAEERRRRAARGARRSRSTGDEARVADPRPIRRDASEGAGEGA